MLLLWNETRCLQSALEPKVESTAQRLTSNEQKNSQPVSTKHMPKSKMEKLIVRPGLHSNK